MWVIRKSEVGNLWTVGHYQPPLNNHAEGCWKWIPLEDHKKKCDAITQVAVLNGGPIS